MKCAGPFFSALFLSSVASAGHEYENPLDVQDFSYSESRIEELIAKAEATKDARVKQAFSHVTGEGLREAFCPYFADLWLGREPDRVNAELVEIFTTKDPAVNPSFLNGHLKLAKLHFFPRFSVCRILQVAYFQRPDFSGDAV